ncbi:DTW domain-containing protein [Jimgerdemannia flammicorona]|uniref:tRNA-uridine aminocarboxypropyltransferase 1 n=1 Tax=Jimgerdemannia flammicorona TaxID=994334 RepID=A0A433QFX9_9FUNG|nr:DTW domain-containing protein [Jimgerdemannia flammicorona]
MEDLGWNFDDIIEENISKQEPQKQAASTPSSRSSLLPPESTPSWSFFNEFHGISDTSFLYALSDRNACPKCQKPVKYFCYWCFEIVGCPPEQVPKIRLPIKMDVIKHENERDGKSTAVHAKIIAPDDVEIYPWNNFPEYDDPDEVVLLFVGKDAKTLSQMPQASFSKLVVVDGTWAQATKMVRDTPQLARLRRVTIAPRKTLFWRFQNKDEHHLATIEAMYYFFREYYDAYEAGTELDTVEASGLGRGHMNFGKDVGQTDGLGSSSQSASTTDVSASTSASTARPYDGRYDNMLFYYKFFYEMIQGKYRQDQGKRVFNKRQREGYIQYDDE